MSASRRKRPHTKRKPAEVAPALAHGLGVWLATGVWAAMAQHVLPGQSAVFDDDVSMPAIVLICVLPAVLCAAGFAIGSTWQTPGVRAAAVPTPMWRLAAGGLLLTLAIGLLLPLLAALQAGPWPVMVAGVAGSAILATGRRFGGGRVERPRGRRRQSAA